MHLLVRVLVLIRDWSSLRKQQVGASQLVVKDHIAMVWLTGPHQLLLSLTKLIDTYSTFVTLKKCSLEINQIIEQHTQSNIFWTPKYVQQIPKCSWQILDMPQHLLLLRLHSAIPVYKQIEVQTISNKMQMQMQIENTNARFTTPMPLCLHSLYAAPLIPLYHRNDQNQRTFCQSVAARSFRYNWNCVLISIRENQA